MAEILSAYERRRLENIARNNKVLRELGLAETGSKALAADLAAGPQKSKENVRAAAGRKRKARRVAASTVPQRPTRRSRRVRGIDAEGNKVPPPLTKIERAKRATGPPAWALRVFAECDAEAPAADHDTDRAGRFDARRHHQHLTLAPSGRIVATTGCAGYGAALATSSPDGAGGGKKARFWLVRAKRFGVGGYAVGAARRSMKKPFKSIGKHPDALVWHSSGIIMRNRKTLRMSGPHGGEKSSKSGDGTSCGKSSEEGNDGGFEEGDVVGVELLKNTVAFHLNGEMVGSVDFVGAADECVLAVQPYMGGVAEMLFAGASRTCR
jgi:hypothetical protein